MLKNPCSLVFVAPFPSNGATLERYDFPGQCYTSVYASKGTGSHVVVAEIRTVRSVRHVVIGCRRKLKGATLA